MSLHVSLSVKVNPRVLKSLDVADKNNLLGRCTGRFDRAKMVYLQIIFNSSLLHGNEKGKMDFQGLSKSTERQHCRHTQLQPKQKSRWCSYLKWLREEDGEDSLN